MNRELVSAARVAESRWSAQARMHRWHAAWDSLALRRLNGMPERPRCPVVPIAKFLDRHAGAGSVSAT